MPSWEVLVQVERKRQQLLLVVLLRWSLLQSLLDVIILVESFRHVFRLVRLFRLRVPVVGFVQLRSLKLPQYAVLKNDSEPPVVRAPIILSFSFDHNRAQLARLETYAGMVRPLLYLLQLRHVLGRRL